jgi:hypothetical protein
MHSQSEYEIQEHFQKQKRDSNSGCSKQWDPKWWKMGVRMVGELGYSTQAVHWDTDTWHWAALWQAHSSHWPRMENSQSDKLGRKKTGLVVVREWSKETDMVVLACFEKKRVQKSVVQLD